ncbi:MAG TPA: D-2-hydroxyacid dehydrogenase [Acidobacteriota bacterium]|nr:D-2-hydroxyacid dehydrogenase [Acidobacteriota bacterium]
MTAAEENVARLQPDAEQIAPVLVWHSSAEDYRKALMQRLPGVPVEVRSGSVRAKPSEARALLTWNPPPGALAQLPALEWIQVMGAGVDNLIGRDDLPASVRLTRSLGRFGDQMAEYVVGYLLHQLIAIEDYRRDQDRGVWDGHPRPLLQDSHIGLIGLGSIGQVVAERLAGFGAEISGACRTARPVQNVSHVYDARNWRQMVPDCDALVLTLPLTPETHGMIDADVLAQMRPSSVLINVSRGALIDEEALVLALRDGVLRAAVLDVFEQEPLPKESPLWTEPRAWITPHVAGPSEIDSIADEFADNYRRFIDGAPLAQLVDRQQGY